MVARFRCGVGMVIVDHEGRVLAFERADIPGAFQLPQGGMEDGEEPEAAMWRELHEETGLGVADVTIVGEVPEWLGYELPFPARSKKTGRGQVHKWFILRADQAQLPVTLHNGTHAEFRSWRWCDLGQLASEVAPFRQAVYRRLAEFAARC